MPTGATSEIHRPGGGLLWRLVPMTLRGRLALTYVLLIVGLMAAFGGYLVFAIRDLYIDRLSDQLESQAHLAAEAVAPAMVTGGGIEEVDAIVKRLGTNLEGRITIVAAGGLVLGDSQSDPRSMSNHSTRPEIVQALSQGMGSTSRPSQTLDRRFLYVAVPMVEMPGAVARVALPLDDVDEAVGRVQRGVALAALVAAALAATVAVFVARKITGPLAELQHHAGAVAAGRLDATVAPDSTRELGNLARSFNVMTERVHDLVRESQRSRIRLEAIFANLSDGVVLIDKDGVVLGLNAASCRILGVDLEWAVGQPFVVVSRDHELVGLLRQAVARGVPRTATIEYARTGTIIEAAAQPLAAVDEELGIVVVRDVTHVRRLETIRREFVANVSHELRTPLASIRAVVETLEAGAINDPEVSVDFLGRIVGEVDRLAALVDELLDLARLESGRVTLQLDALDPRDLLTRGAERLRPQTERARLDLVVEIPPDLPPVLADRARIEQVLLNLVHNAIKFTPAGGTITVTAMVERGMLRAMVEDTGVGIAEAELPRLFERFYKADRARRSDGSGLGLAIAKHIVQAHKGAIWATSLPGDGATFSFTLPLAEMESDDAVAVANGARAGRRVSLN